MNKQPIVVIIGAGNMGASLACGLISNYPKENIWLTDTADDKLIYLKNKFGFNTSKNNAEAVAKADVIIFAVKPQIISSIVTELASAIQKRKPLVLSIAAGILENSLQHWLGGKISIVRAMPNTPALIGCGATGLFANTYVTGEQKNLAEAIMRAVGVTVWVEDEELMDVVTALSGSGPAYYFLILEAFQDAAISLGLPKDIARLLSLQTAYGSARMALESEQDVIALRKQVTSPGGTTEQAIRVLEEGHLRELIAKALQAANHRSKELSNPK